MKRSAGRLLGFLLLIAWARIAWAQGGGDEVIHPHVLEPGRSSLSLEQINADYNRKLLDLERERLDRLAKLAAQLPARDASAVYEQYFRLAIAHNLFTDAEPLADRIIASRDSSAGLRLLARTVDVVAAADRGAFDESLNSLKAAFGEARQDPDGPAARPLVDSSSMLALCEAYYQRLVHAGQLEIARKAFETLAAETKNPAVRAYCSSRLNQLRLIGRPAPQIRAIDLDGKPVDLAAFKGKVVLIDFWASWCEPCAQELEWLSELYSTYHAQGFEVIGVNLDLAAEGATRESILPNIRRYLLDHNVRWPSVLNGSGAGDLGKAYGVAEIPCNVLVGRDGTVIHLDLSRANAAEVIARACGR